jgi:Tfp pilus assembly protein PilP
MTTRMLRACASCLLAVFCVSGAWVAVAAQGAARKPTVVPPAPPAVARPGGQEAYSYKSGGLRDPFLSLVNRGTDNRLLQKKPEGLRGLTFDEIALRGILQGGRPGAIAIVQAPDTRTYRVHVGDQLYDAVVKAITADSLVVLQEVSDPLSLRKQIERRKTLRVVEEVK